ncbi:MAG: hypothetical protein GX601_05315 [Anaerolineales bacterium]|nr:hypothetical protein [Anaerolineales bacterium]
MNKPISDRENWLRAVEFRHPEWIPCRIALSPLTWHIYREKLERIVLAHPRIFPRHQPCSVNYDEMPVVYRQGERHRDNWGCVWYNIQEGLEGQVIEHPLADWSALANYRPPDPLIYSERGTRDWAQTEQELAAQKEQGLLTWGSGERLFDRLYLLRGFTELMIDFAERRPELAHLIDLLTQHELVLINRWLHIGVDVISFHTDIGTQRGLMISPRSFHEYIKPMFRTLFQTCRRAGAHVYLSSDGRVLDIVDDLVECGVSVHDPQLRANTLDGIARAYTGKLCADVDLDRQGFPFMTPADIRAQLRDVVRVMGAPEGGLMMLASVYGADVPLANIQALCDAMEDYCLS